MIKVLRSKRILLFGFTPGFSVDEKKFQKYKEIRGFFINDPWERVKTIFSKDDHGDTHPELQQAMHMFKMGLYTGAIYGGLKVVSQKKEAYLHSNDMNVFANTREALKAYANYSMKSFVEGSLKSALPFGCFLFSFSLISSCCELYRNKASVIDSVAAGVVAGSLSRFMFGIKGIISGGVVGGVLGTIYGVLLWGVLKVSNTDLLEVKYANFVLKNYRKQFDDVESSKVSNEDKVIKDKPLNELKRNKAGSNEQTNTNI